MNELMKTEIDSMNDASKTLNKNERTMTEMTDTNETINPMEAVMTTKVDELNEGSTDKTSWEEVIVSLELDKIKIRDDLRCREREDERAINDYAKSFKENMEAADKGKPPIHNIPPIKVWHIDGQYFLLGGFHRVEAARCAGCDTIQAKVFDGTEDEAFVIALQDNSTHGERLSPSDLKYAVGKAIQRFPDKSLRAIAKEVGRSISTVSKINSELHTLGVLKPVEKRRGIDGRDYIVKTKGTTKESDAVVAKNEPKITKRQLDRQVDKILKPLDDVIMLLSSEKACTDFMWKVQQYYWKAQRHSEAFKSQAQQEKKECPPSN